MAFPSIVDSTWVNSAGVSLNAGELRRADAAAFAGAGSALGVGGGVVRHGDTSLAVSVDGSDVVTVQPGAVLIPGNAVAGTGCYRSGLAAAITGALGARHASFSRIDLIVFRQLDTDVVGTHTAFTARVDVVPGIPSGSPGAPALPSMAVELARITVPPTGGGTGTVDSSFRTFATAIGGAIVVPSLARLPGAAAVWQRAIALDTGLQYEYDGTSWKRVGAWRTYTPALTGWSLHDGTLVGWWKPDADGFDFEIEYTIGSSDVHSSGGPIFSLPQTAAGSAASGFSLPNIGRAEMVNTGTTRRGWDALLNSSTTVRPVDPTTGLGVSPTSPWTWSTGDAMRLIGKGRL